MYIYIYTFDMKYLHKYLKFTIDFQLFYQHHKVDDETVASFSNITYIHCLVVKVNFR